MKYSAPEETLVCYTWSRFLLIPKETDKKKHFFLIETTILDILIKIKGEIMSMKKIIGYETIKSNKSLNIWEIATYFKYK